MKYITTLKDHEYTIEIISEKKIIVDGTLYDVDFESISGQPVFSLLLAGESHEAYVYPDEDQWEVLLQGLLYPVLVEDEREKSKTLPCLHVYLAVMRLGEQRVPAQGHPGECPGLSIS
jgi:hypothetical protein